MFDTHILNKIIHGANKSAQGVGGTCGIRAEVGGIRIVTTNILGLAPIQVLIHLPGSSQTHTRKTTAAHLSQSVLVPEVYPGIREKMFPYLEEMSTPGGGKLGMGPK